uniref:Uncharacterized protein n=1 Tax=Oryza meridionalis TaxID=40149 RepID=A0A0E0DE57_9ORYZ
MTLNRHPGNATRVWRWSIFERVSGFAQKVSAPLEDVGWFWGPRALCCLKLLAFGKLGNDDLCEVSIVAFFSFSV